ncbi:MAG: hypothetical protein J0I88_02480 [Chryseobacterium sp.]|nr:hypothetical protein [Chryseobacterium sp.]
MTIPEKIIKKLSLDLYPELNSDMIYKLSNESERGAVLIGTSKIEEYLELFVKKILPNDSKKYQKKLLQYPGPLSSFSSKIELLYAFRYINHQFYVSLNILRSIRNNAAHSYIDFDLEEENQKIEQINEFVDDDLKYVIDEIALDNMVEIKKKKLIRIYQEKGFKVDDKYIEKAINEFKTTNQKDKQYRIWRLSYGIVFMCLYILVLIDDNDSLNDKQIIHPIKL